MDDRNEIMVSIIMPTYGHEKYIEQAINSVLMQKVNFKYEVLIGEDCSPDNTRQILKNMEQNLPECFHIFYRETNFGSKNNCKDLQERSIGKYWITLEADDYWLNPLKLQKQVDFLESNTDYIAIAHNVKVVDENNNEVLDYSYPECKHEEYTIYDYREGLFCGQTASILCKNYPHDKSIPILRAKVPFPGDKIKSFLLTSWGKVYCVQEQWSAYRYVTNSGLSYSATDRKKQASDWNERCLVVYKQMIDYANIEVKSKDSIVVSECLYYSAARGIIKEKKYHLYNRKQYLHELLSANYKLEVYKYLFSKYVVKRLYYNILDFLVKIRKKFLVKRLTKSGTK